MQLEGAGAGRLVRNDEIGESLVIGRIEKGRSRQVVRAGKAKHGFAIQDVCFVRGSIPARNLSRVATVARLIIPLLDEIVVYRGSCSVGRRALGSVEPQLKIGDVGRREGSSLWRAKSCPSEQRGKREDDSPIPNGSVGTAK